jgi:hypothetical protein
MQLIAFLVAGLTLVALTCPAGALRRRRTMVFGCASVILLTVAQVAPAGRLYPFDKWSMYSSNVPRPEYTTHTVVLRDGRRREFPFRSFVGPEPRRAQMRIRQLIVECGCSHGNPRVDRVLAAFAALYRVHLEVAIQRWEVRTIRVVSGQADPASRLDYVWQPVAVDDETR